MSFVGTRPEVVKWDEVSEGAVHVAKETQNGCWADIRI